MFNSNIIDNLFKMSFILKNDNDFLEGYAVRFYDECAVVKSINEVQLDLSKLAAGHPAIIRRAFRCALNDLRGSLKGIENKAIKAFLNACPDYIGRIFGRNGKQKGNIFCYELYLTSTEINYDILSSYGFVVESDIPCFTSAFASSTVTNDEQKINAAWDYLYSQWLQNSMLEYTNEPYSS
jgi:predicted transcriptional regulator YdeE